MNVMGVKSEASDLLDLLSRNKKELDQIVLEFLPKEHSTPEIVSMYEMMRDYPSRGGKGVRGSLCLLWCDLFGGERKHALNTAAALELFQNWILIHDDIEDESDLRRGLPALHKKYGIPLSINAGDALHGKMWEMLVRNREIMGSDLAVKILSEFSTMLNETTEGQQMELFWTTNSKWSISEKDYFLMVTKKAAWYTCITPARLGVILSSAGRNGKPNEDVLERLIRIGTELGISFQIVDDVLNLTADEGKYGKEILGDLYEGKRTLMLIHLLAHCSSEEGKKIVSTLSKPRQEKTQNEIEEIFRKMKACGSIEYAKAVAQEHSRNALADFDSLVEEMGLSKSESYGTTRFLMSYLTTRDY